MTEPDRESARIPAHLAVSGLVRRVQQAGGFAAILAKGEPEAGTILVVLAHNGAPQRAFERMPLATGERRWTETKAEDPADPQAFSAWLERRHGQDPDLWMVELDVPEGERFIS